MVCANTNKLVMLDMGQMKAVDYATMVDLAALVVAMASGMRQESIAQRAL